MSVSRRALAYVSRYVSLLLLRLAGTSDGAISRLLTDCAISRISLGHRLRRFFARAADAAKPKHSISGTDSVEHFDKQNYRERSLLRSDELHYYKRYNEPDAACNRSSPCVTRTPCPPSALDAYIETCRPPALCGTMSLRRIANATKQRLTANGRQVASRKQQSRILTFMLDSVQPRCERLGEVHERGDGGTQ